MQIQSLKNKIIDFLQKYNYSYNYFSSKKVLERKFINHILYVIFKYNHYRFKKINLDDFIITSIQKELNNIIKFLLTQNHNKDKESQINDLITKINQEIKYFEGKRKKNGNKFSINNFTSKRIILTEEDKALLTNYSLSIIDESFSTIFADKSKKFNDINPERLQVIIEFLFFIRDKTIAIIHLLNDAAILFFDFLNKGSSNNLKDKFNENEININLDNTKKGIDNCDIEELDKNYKFTYSNNHKNLNKKIFDVISVKPKDDIKCISALDYIFNRQYNKSYLDELNYLYVNVVLPERNEVFNNTGENKNNEVNHYISMGSNIENIYNLIDNQFKNDPIYKTIIK